MLAFTKEIFGDKDFVTYVVNLFVLLCFIGPLIVYAINGVLGIHVPFTTHSCIGGAVLYMFFGRALRPGSTGVIP